MRTEKRAAAAKGENMEKLSYGGIDYVLDGNNMTVKSPTYVKEFSIDRDGGYFRRAFFDKGKLFDPKRNVAIWAAVYDYSVFIGLIEDPLRNNPRSFGVNMFERG